MENSKIFWISLNLCIIFINSQNTVDLVTLLKNQPSIQILKFNNSFEALSLKTTLIQDTDLLLLNENELLKMDFLIEGLNSSILIMNQSNVSIVNFNIRINSTGYALNLFENSTLLIHVKFNKIIL